MEERILLSLLSVEKLTGSSDNNIGIPWEVPVPKKVIFIYKNLTQKYENTVSYGTKIGIFGKEHRINKHGCNT
ncbi:hypothetical protein GCM10011397_18330 [Wenyingzhuangia marina]|nr:hypothetical protein GCM10011397_18330 [Wenyingzhuangia marina]